MQPQYSIKLRANTLALVLSILLLCIALDSNGLLKIIRFAAGSYFLPLGEQFAAGSYILPLGEQFAAGPAFCR
jgi:hypothetical protein